MKSSNPLQSKEPGIGNDIYYAAPAVSPNANHQVQRLFCSLLTALPNQYLMLHRHWRINNLRIQRANNNLFNVLHPFGTETYMFLLNNSKNIAMKPIYSLKRQQFNILRLFFRTKMIFPLTLNPQMRKMSIHAFRTLQRSPLS